MHSFSEPAIPQAMQQHGGRNRAVIHKRPEPELPLVLPAEAPLAPVLAHEAGQAGAPAGTKPAA